MNKCFDISIKHPGLKNPILKVICKFILVTNNKKKKPINKYWSVIIDGFYLNSSLF